MGAWWAGRPLHRRLLGGDTGHVSTAGKWNAGHTCNLTLCSIRIKKYEINFTVSTLT